MKKRPTRKDVTVLVNAYLEPQPHDRGPAINAAHRLAIHTQRKRLSKTFSSADRDQLRVVQDAADKLRDEFVRLRVPIDAALEDGGFTEQHSEKLLWYLEWLAAECEYIIHMYPNRRKRPNDQKHICAVGSIKIFKRYNRDRAKVTNEDLRQFAEGIYGLAVDEKNNGMSYALRKAFKANS